VGAQRPAYCTAIGKALLAELPGKDTEAYLARTKLVPFTDSTITSQERLLADLKEARRAGAAYDDHEFNGELRCIAAPVRNYTGKAIAALGLSGPLWRVSLQQLPDLTRKVIAAASGLSAELGYSASKSGKD
jgi:DNA-binding IclR family transcriptional regulator